MESSPRRFFDYVLVCCILGMTALAAGVSMGFFQIPLKSAMQTENKKVEVFLEVLVRKGRILRNAFPERQNPKEAPPTPEVHRKSGKHTKTANVSFKKRS